MSGEGKSAKVKARQRLAVGTWVLWQMPAEPPPPQESRELLRAAERRKDIPPAPWTSLHSICPNMHSASKQPRCSVYHSFLCFSAPYLQGNLTEANTMVTIPDSWKKPRVVKVKRKRLLQGQSKVCFPSNPRFNVRVHWGVKEPKPTSEHSLVKIRRRTPHWTLKLTPPRYRRKQALTMEKKESGRQTLCVKTRKKKQGPRLKRKQPRLWMLFYQVHFVAWFSASLQNTLLHQTEHGKLLPITKECLTYLRQCWCGEIHH